MKLIELALQARPKALLPHLFHRDPEQRHSMRWYTQMGRRVWFHELVEVLLSQADGEEWPDAGGILGSAARMRRRNQCCCLRLPAGVDIEPWMAPE